MERYFNINLSDLILLKRIEDKYEQFKLAKSVKISVPDTWVIKIRLISQLKHNKNWPIFVKGGMLQNGEIYLVETPKASAENFKDLKYKTLKALKIM